MNPELVTSLAVQGNTHHAGYIIQLGTAQGKQQFLLPPKAVAHLIERLVRYAQGAVSHDMRLALDPLTIESVSVGVLHGQTTLAAATQSGVELVSTIDRADLERLVLEIQAALATVPPAHQ